jgi:hypothetical protein
MIGDLWYLLCKDARSSKPCKTLFIIHTINLENVQRYQIKGRVLKDVKLAQTRC